MTIRLRLALWYGGLTGLVLAFMALFSYGFHGRTHYDDLDRILLTSAEQATVAMAGAEGLPHFATQCGSLNMVLRLYDLDAAVLEMVPEISQLRPVDPEEVLAGPNPPAFDWIIGLVTRRVGGDAVSEEGAFGVLLTDKQRWRIYVTPLRVGQETVRYLEASAPLGDVDASMRAFRRMLLLRGIGAVLVALAGSWATASGAFRSVSRMVATARSISGSRDLSRRVEVTTQRDELSELARAFNDMLASLQGALAAQQRFVSDAAHELRTPLTAIQGNLELLERHPEMPPEDRQEALQEASRQARRLTRLVTDLLALARADAGIALPRQRVELDQVMMEAVREAHQLAQATRIEIDTVEPAAVSGNADWLKQLLSILLDNAIKYSHEGSRVTVSLRRSSTHATVTVADAGVGIERDALPHVFERFYRADPGRSHHPGGTGLGLAIAKWVIEQHDGQITVASAPDQGTTVTVVLPLDSF